MGEVRQAARLYDKPEFPLYLEEKTEKKDNVRQYWENELIQFALKPLLKTLVQKRTEQNRKLRILDLGSDLGQGFDLFTQIAVNPADLGLEKKFVLNEDMIALYLGLDLNYNAVEQANEIYQAKKKVRFIKTDYRKGLGLFKECESPFDVYFSSFGSLSDLDEKMLQTLLCDIAEHAQDGSLVVLDVLGKNALFKKSNLHTQEHTFWTQEDLLLLLENVAFKTDTKFEIRKQIDRSILIAQSSSNWQYGIWFKNLRSTIHQLFEANVRTDLNKLILKTDTFPEFGNPIIKRFWANLIQHWNIFVWFAIERMENEINPKDIDGWEDFSSLLQFAMMTLDRLMRDTAWISYGDTRANIIEPHIAYVLRSFEFELQKGMACGQHFSVILEVKK